MSQHDLSKVQSNDVVSIIRKGGQNALRDPETHLYFPRDSEGNVCDVTRAVYLECWRSDLSKKSTVLPEVFSVNIFGLTCALVKSPSDLGYRNLPYVIAHLSLAKVNDWFHTLERLPEGDKHNLKIYNN